MGGVILVFFLHLNRKLGMAAMACSLMGHLEMMSLSEMGPQLEFPINVVKGSMPLQCNIFSENSCHSSYQNTCKV